MNKPKIFTVTSTPKNADNTLSVAPDLASKYYCAVVNVSDSQCATFDYQKAGIPSFWFPINEIAYWGHSPFFGTLWVVNEYFRGDNPILIHCHAGANRSPSIAYAILRAKGYTPKEAEQSLNYDEMSQVFKRNIEMKRIPKNIIQFLIEADKDATSSLRYCLSKIDALYEEWAKTSIDQQQDYTILGESEEQKRLIYNKESKRFVIVKDNE